MIKYYFLAGALALMAIQAFYITAKKNEIKTLQYQNGILSDSNKELNMIIDELKQRHLKELDTIKELENNRTNINSTISSVKDKANKSSSGNFIKDFNNAINEAFNSVGF